MPHTEMVAEFVEKLGSFYEVVDDKVPKHLANGKTIAGKIMKKAESVSAPANGSGGAGDAAAGLVNDRGRGGASLRHFDSFSLHMYQFVLISVCMQLV